jgi:hypothetical protein
MQLLDGRLILSASDLNNFFACEHLTALDLARARGELAVEPERGADAELLARKGDEFERRYLDSLKAEGRGDRDRSPLLMNQGTEPRKAVETLIYDYVDAELPVLRRMFSKRLKAYRALGYKLESTA